jgi:hypothetical protein
MLFTVSAFSLFLSVFFVEEHVFFVEFVRVVFSHYRHRPALISESVLVFSILPAGVKCPVCAFYALDLADLELIVPNPPEQA